MVRFSWAWGLKVCVIHHLPQLKQSNTCSFERKKKKKKKENPKERHPRWSHLRLTELGYSGSFKSCPCRRQNQDWVCVSLQRGRWIGQIRARSDGLSCPPNHPRSPPCRDFDASCKTSQLRVRKRLIP